MVRFLPRARAQGNFTMTTIDRNSFDAATLAALDDVARLLHIYKAVRGMNQTFKQAVHLSASEAKPAARKILKVSKTASAALIEAVFDRDPEKIVEARQRHLKGLQSALQHAEELAQQERAALPEVGERGVFRQHVEIPLRKMTQAWAAGA